ncbi:MAG TPA: TPM domain-containing protein [Gammaproteobacteria bacterium]
MIRAGTAGAVRSATFLVIVLALLALATTARAQQPVPPLTARAMDLTDTLAPEALDALNTRLAALEERTGAQVAVLIVPTTVPEAIEQYALRVVETWQLGRAGVDDGLLLLIAKDDRRLRFEVGYGLEGAIPDAIANRIIDERIVPRFYVGDYAGGIDAGLDAVAALIEGESLPPPVDARGRDAPGAVSSVLPLLVVAAVLFAPIVRRLLGSVLGPAVLGAGAGFVAWLVAGGLLVSFVAGVIVFIIALAGGTGGPGRWSSGRRGAHVFLGGLGRGGGGFGGGGFGGGFRRGGGRFGGGGASGGW